MLTALRTPQSVLVLGASSQIAAAVTERLAAISPLQRIVLAGRPGPARDDAAERARAQVGEGGVVEVVDFDALQPTTHADMLHAVFDAGDVDVTVLAVGVLPAEPSPADPVAAADVVTANFTGAVSALTVVGQRARHQGHGTIVVLSSLAGERVRRTNYLYGATKAGLDAFARGLGEDLRGTGVDVLVVRPGFVHTVMTTGMPAAPLAVQPADVARAVVQHLGTGSRTLWVPRVMRPLMSVLRHLPQPLFRRLPL